MFDLLPTQTPTATVRERGPAAAGVTRLIRLMAVGVAVAAALGSLIMGALIGYLAFLVATVDVPPAPRLPQTTTLLDRDGEPLATLHTDIDRHVIPFGRMPKSLIAAVLATEDKGFYAHGAVDPEAIVRAALTNLQAGGVVEGGSTITQQYVKNVYTSGAQTLGRKLREMALAIDLEDRLTKDQILARYLNTIFLGNGAYGVEAAARRYFGRHAADLTVRQSATLAGIIAAPSRFDPVRHPNRAERRRTYVLGELAEVGYLSEDRARRLSRKDLGLERPRAEPDEAPYFTDHVRRFLEARYRKRRTAAALGSRPVAGKTGTAQEYTNAWFCGYVRQLAACVWVGYPQGNIPMNGITGGSIPASIWHDFMTAATRGMPVRGFPEPSLDAFGPPTYVPLSTYTATSTYTPPQATSSEDGNGDDQGEGNNGNAYGHDHGNGND